MKPFRYLAKPLRVLILINAAVFVLAFLAQNLRNDMLFGSIVGYGSLIPAYFMEPWRYVTYMFVHVQFMHFIFNMLMLWMFGDEIAEWMGNKHFVAMYMFCGIFSGLFSIPFYLSGALNPYAFIIGASGALMGIFVAYYKFFPERRLLLFFFIPMKIKYAMWVLVAVDVFFANSGDTIAHFTHLGGVVAGFIYMWFYQGGFSKFGRIFIRPKIKVSSNKKESAGIEGVVFYIDEEKRMDEILRKVNDSGIHSLTDGEKQFLLQASDRIRRRRG
ncbi:MAG: rhomboid family intramembrane serine protease [Fibrobacteraceae bacterium]|nr:rhomboid family intramembrane serine protease [Fibrobacteraceae bacterium]